MNMPVLGAAIVRMEKTIYQEVASADDFEGPKYAVRPINLYIQFYSGNADWSDYRVLWCVKGRQILKSGDVGKAAKNVYRWEYEQLPRGVPQWITDAIDQHRPVQP